MRTLLSELLALWRRLQLAVWVARGRSRMKWVGIRFAAELGDGVVFVRTPFLLAGIVPPGTPGSLTLRIGNRVRFAPGVIIEVEPGHDSVLEIGDATRIGAGAHFYLRGGSIRIGPGCEIRDSCVLRATGGELQLGRHCFMSYGCVVAATERIVLEDRVGLSERVTVVDSRHDSDGSDVHWTEHPLTIEPIEIADNTLVFANSVINRGARIGANSQVAANSVVLRGDYPASVRLGGVPAEPIATLADDD